jgi:MATE family, multidrug efflux pump
VFLALGFAGIGPYAHAMRADGETAALAAAYLLWFIPAMALQFPMVSMGSALRAVGNFKTGTVVGTVTVILNMVLAPILIFGWGTGRPFGVAGAAISSLVALVVGNVWLAAYFLPRGAYLRFETADWKPRFDLWKRMLAIGLPAGVEFAITAAYLAIVYSITRPFGAAAQAAFGIGMRIFQAAFMPVVALGFSVAPVAGQNFGARQPHRVIHTFRDAAWMAAGVMAIFSIACQIAPASMVSIFSDDPDVIRIGAEYLRIVAWASPASGLIFVASSMFQAMGNTIPSLVTSAVRIAIVSTFALTATRMPGFELRWIWYVSVASVVVQLALSMALLRRQFAQRLRWEPILKQTTA